MGILFQVRWACIPRGDKSIPPMSMVPKNGRLFIVHIVMKYHPEAP
jgi:hypothetical protein